MWFISLTWTTRYRPGSRAILANSSASSLKDGRLSASSIQPGNSQWSMLSSSSMFPTLSLGFTSSSAFPSYISGVHIFFFFFCIPQLYLWGSHLLLLLLHSPAISLGFTSSSSAFPSHISGVHHFGWDFCDCDRFFNSTMEVVTFHLRGWCLLGLFLLPLFIILGHECQDLLSLCHGMQVCTD